MKRVASIFMLFSCVTVQAQDVRTWHFSGADLIAAMEGKMPSEIRDASLARQFYSAYAQAYVTGIADQTQGTVWCTRTGVLPHELKDRVHSYLTALPGSRANGNAGPLVGEALARSFPCR
ncbi:Rap1a/Tai family immunity protein [Achromobacter mucicolens]|uniref:Rap1a/Tai family immunity protein n=1 Tax=Achromobacter mucicolens TaxID=1389922 RepID=A0ABD4YZI3_9BURK|nr:Rap1a/Tai family immunity protein [Achromobacter mucicolens]MDH1180578.1 Rap1a/Tai family immunity protein [Achromobacter mucicolens]